MCLYSTYMYQSVYVHVSHHIQEVYLHILIRMVGRLVDVEFLCIPEGVLCACTVRTLNGMCVRQILCTHFRICICVLFYMWSAYTTFICTCIQTHMYGIPHTIQILMHAHCFHIQNISVYMIYQHTDKYKHVCERSYRAVFYPCAFEWNV